MGALKWLENGLVGLIGFDVGDIWLAHSKLRVGLGGPNEGLGLHGS